MYNSISKQPPDHSVNVIDVYGKTGVATPTYYPFYTVRDKDFPKRLKVIHCDPYWDGGWLIESDFSGSKRIDEIIGWMIINH